MEHISEKYKQLIYVLIFTAAFAVIGAVTGLIFIKPVFTSTASYLVTDTSGLHHEIIHPDEIREFFTHDYFNEHLSERLSYKYTAEELKKTVKVKPNRYSPSFKVKVTCKNASDVFFIHKTIESAPRYLTPEMSDEYFLIIQINEAKFPERASRPGFGIILLIFALAGSASSVLFMKKQNIHFSRKASESIDKYNIPVIARIPWHRSTGSSSDGGAAEFTSAFLKNSGINMEKRKNTGISSYNPDKNTIMIGPETSIDFFDAFRHLFQSIEKMSDEGRNIILFTSPINGDGKTTAAINLSITAAAEGKKVLLIDCNLRNRRISRAFNTEPSTPGLYDIVFKAMPAKDAILFTEYHSLFLLPAGECATNPVSLLTRAETLRTIRELGTLFDYVIIDTPPVNVFPDAIVLAEAADYLFLTIRTRFTPDEETQKALKSIELSELEISGFILNAVSSTTESTQSVKPVPSVNKNKFISGDFRI